jgi:hypothetical protein
VSILRSKAAARRTLSVFVSYSTNDLPIVERVQKALESAGASVFVAEHSVPPGNSLKADISAALNRSELVVVLWSKHASESKWVGHEIGHASGRDKRIITFLLDQDAEVPSFLGDGKHIPAHRDLKGGIEALTGRVRVLFAERQQRIADRQSEAIAILIGCVLVFAALSEAK